MSRRQTVEEAAREWLNASIMSHESCIERLVSICNEQVNERAKYVQIHGMRDELEIFRFLESLLPADLEADGE